MKKYIIVFIFVFFLVGCSNKESTNNKEYLKYVGTYISEVRNENDSYDCLLFLRDDKTFRITIVGKSATNYVGVYSVEKDILKLQLKVIFKDNGCYYKEGYRINKEHFNTFEVKIVNSSTLKMAFNNNLINLKRNNEVGEMPESIEKFNVNILYDNEYKDCSKEAM